MSGLLLRFANAARTGAQPASKRTLALLAQACSPLQGAECLARAPVSAAALNALHARFASSRDTPSQSRSGRGGRTTSRRAPAASEYEDLDSVYEFNEKDFKPPAAARQPRTPAAFQYEDRESSRFGSSRASEQGERVIRQQPRGQPSQPQERQWSQQRSPRSFDEAPRSQPSQPQERQWGSQRASQARDERPAQRQWGDKSAPSDGYQQQQRPQQPQQRSRPTRQFYDGEENLKLDENEPPRRDYRADRKTTQHPVQGQQYGRSPYAAEKQTEPRRDSQRQYTDDRRASAPRDSQQYQQRQQGRVQSDRSQFKPRPVAVNPLPRFGADGDDDEDVADEPRRHYDGTSPNSRRGDRTHAARDTAAETRSTSTETSTTSKDDTRDFLYGFAPVTAALMSKHRKFYELLLEDREPQNELTIARVQKILDLAASIDLKVSRVPRNVLQSYMENKNRPHQGVLLKCSPRDYVAIDTLTMNKILTSPPAPKAGSLPINNVWLALDEVHDPMNLGAILRSAYFFGVPRVIVCKKNTCPITPTVSKASSGASELMKIFAVDNMEYFLNVAKKNGWSIAGTCGPYEKADQPMVSSQQWGVTKPTILLVGNEGYGVRGTLAKLCDTLVTIQPTNTASVSEFVDSLNVSVASGALLHHLSRPLSVPSTSAASTYTASTETQPTDTATVETPTVATTATLPK